MSRVVHDPVRDCFEKLNLYWVCSEMIYIKDGWDVFWSLGITETVFPTFESIHLYLFLDFWYMQSERVEQGICNVERDVDDMVLNFWYWKVYLFCLSVKKSKKLILAESVKTAQIANREFPPEEFYCCGSAFNLNPLDFQMILTDLERTSLGLSLFWSH